MKESFIGVLIILGIALSGYLVSLYDKQSIQQKRDLCIQQTKDPMYCWGEYR